MIDPKIKELFLVKHLKTYSIRRQKYEKAAMMRDKELQVSSDLVVYGEVDMINLIAKSYHLSKGDVSSIIESDDFVKSLRIAQIKKLISIINELHNR